jgi:hypothetical protein
MPERAKDSGLSLREAAHAEAEDLAGAVQRTNERLERTLKRVPLLDNLLDWRLVLLAGAVGIVVAGVVRLLSSWLASVAVFLVVFLAVMLVIAGRRTGD